MKKAPPADKSKFLQAMAFLRQAIASLGKLDVCIAKPKPEPKPDVCPYSDKPKPKRGANPIRKTVPTSRHLG